MKFLSVLAGLVIATCLMSAEASAAPKRSKHIETNIRYSERAVMNLASNKSSRAAKYYAYLQISGT